MKHFCFTSGKSEYIEPAKRAHVVPPPRGRGRGGFGQGIRPHDIFRQRKQNTSRPPSMHVDDFVAAESKEVVPPDGIPPPKRPLKVSQKISSRGGFSGNRGGRGAFHSQNRFFTPPASKGNCSRWVRILECKHVRWKCLRQILIESIFPVTTVKFCKEYFQW